MKRNSKLNDELVRRGKKVLPQFPSKPYGPIDLVHKIAHGKSANDIFFYFVEKDMSLEYDHVVDSIARLRSAIRALIERGAMKAVTDELYLTPSEVMLFLNPPKKKKRAKPVTEKQRFKATTPEQRRKIIILRKAGYGPTIIGRYLNLKSVHVRGILCSAVYRGKLTVQPLSHRPLDWPRIDLKLAFQEMDEVLAKHENRAKPSAVAA